MSVGGLGFSLFNDEQYSLYANKIGNYLMKLTMHFRQGSSKTYIYERNIQSVKQFGYLGQKYHTLEQIYNFLQNMQTWKDTQLNIQKGSISITEKSRGNVQRIINLVQIPLQLVHIDEKKYACKEVIMIINQRCSINQGFSPQQAKDIQRLVGKALEELQNDKNILQELLYAQKQQKNKMKKDLNDKIQKMQLQIHRMQSSISQLQKSARYHQNNPYPRSNQNQMTKIILHNNQIHNKLQAMTHRINSLQSGTVNIKRLGQNKDKKNIASLFTTKNPLQSQQQSDKITLKQDFQWFDPYGNNFQLEKDTSRSRTSLTPSVMGQRKDMQFKTKRTIKQVAANWVDQQSFHIRNLTLKGNTITAHAGSLVFSWIGLGQSGSYTVLFTNIHEYVGVGIIDSIYRRQPTLKGKQNVIEYGNYGTCILGGQKVHQENGFEQGQPITVTLNRNTGTIQWRVREQIRSELAIPLLRDPKIDWVPLLWLYNRGDSVCIM